jgi:energy-converting hydrogenase Eha subunit G
VEPLCRAALKASPAKKRAKRRCGTNVVPSASQLIGFAVGLIAFVGLTGRSALEMKESVEVGSIQILAALGALLNPSLVNRR